MPGIIKANVYIGDALIQIVGVDDGNVAIKQSSELDSNAHATVHIIAEALRALHSGIRVDHFFNPYEKEGEELLKCEWMRSGKLRVNEEPTHKKYQHAHNMEEALGRHRVFTCTRELFQRLPRRRPKQK